jgi:hypothetical protein
MRLENLKFEREGRKVDAKNAKGVWLSAAS